MHVTWPDIDFGNHVVRVKAKPKLGFIPKDWEEREVPIPDRLLNSCAFTKPQYPKSCTIFPRAMAGSCTTSYVMQNVAWRAGSIAACAIQGKGVCQGPYCQDWFLHKFRATFATMHLRAGVDLTTVQTWMGHKDLESTMRYLKPARDKEALRVNATFPFPKRHRTPTRHMPRRPFGSSASFGEANRQPLVDQNG